MTEALKALESLRQCAMHCESASTKGINEWDRVVGDVLKDHEKNKQFCISAQMHTLKLIDKVQGLVRTLEQIRTDAAIDHNGLPPTQIMGNLLGFIEDAATKSLAEFKEKNYFIAKRMG